MSFTDRIKQFDEYFKITGKGKEMTNKSDVTKATMDVISVEREIWNAAIEAAINKCIAIGGYAADSIAVSLQELKK